MSTPASVTLESALAEARALIVSIRATLKLPRRLRTADAEFESKHPRGEGGKFTESDEEAGHGDTVGGTPAEGGGGVGLPAGSGASDDAQHAAVEPAYDPHTTAVGPRTDRYLTDRTTRGDFTPEFAAQVRSALAEQPPDLRAWVESEAARDNFFMQEVDPNDPTVPAFIKNALGGSAAMTLNGYRVIYQKGKPVSPDSLRHELTHVAYNQLTMVAPELVAEAEDEGRVVGDALLAQAYKAQWRTKTPPENDDDYRVWSDLKYVRRMNETAKRYVRAGKSDLTGALEIELMVPAPLSRAVARFAPQGGDQSDQFRVLSVYAALAKKHNLSLASQYTGEEFVTYRAGHDPAYASKLFAALNSPSGRRRRGIEESRAAGGPGSGNFGHAGRPGQVGGSATAEAPSAEVAQIFDRGALLSPGRDVNIWPIVDSGPRAQPGTENPDDRPFLYNPASGEMVIGTPRDEFHVDAFDTAVMGGSGRWDQDASKRFDQFRVHGFMGGGRIKITNVYVRSADPDERAADLSRSVERVVARLISLGVPTSTTIEIPYGLPEWGDDEARTIAQGWPDLVQKRAAMGAMRFAEWIRTAYREDQPRDEKGQWTSGGAADSGDVHSESKMTPAEIAAANEQFAREQAEAKVERQRRTRDLATQIGFDGARVDFQPTGPVFEVNGRKFEEAAHYSPLTGRITVSDTAAMLSSEDEMKQLLAHEATHDAFYHAFTRPAVEKTVPIAPAQHAFINMVFDRADDLRASDGVSDYSRAYWNRFERDTKTIDVDATPSYYRAINETLAEIARLDTANVGIKIAPVWRDAFNALQRGYMVTRG